MGSESHKPIGEKKSYCSNQMLNSDIDLEGKESYDLHEFPATRGVDGLCDDLREKDTPELSAGDTTEINQYRWPIFEPSQYLAIRRSETI
jgi:hypothetical protein